MSNLAWARYVFAQWTRLLKIGLLPAWQKLFAFGVSELQIGSRE